MSSIHENKFSRLLKIIESVSDSQNLIKEITEEIKSKKHKPLCKMIIKPLKWDLLLELGFAPEFMSLLFDNSRISEFTVHDSDNFVIKCFSMARDSAFHLHDHPNSVTCICVLYGKVKYLSLEPIEEEGWYIQSKKRQLSKGNGLFSIKSARTVCSMLAIENSIVINIGIGRSENISRISIFKAIITHI